MVKAWKLRGGVAAAGGVLLLLAGCGGSPAPLLAEATAPCPHVAVLADAADLTRFRPGGGRDLTAMTLNASLAGFQAKCDYAPKHAGLDVTLTPAFTAERGPAAQGRTAQIPYMVAVAEGESIRDRAAYVLQVEFPPNVARVRSEGEELLIRLPGNPQEAAGKTIWLGFVLTPEELALNRERGPR
ncbi:hypothetical protein [Pseudoroseomonas sp. WGS1072]|uniref:hypothetical protein n=1 Tax=Roseomonas sp. WGS1072 TaxID=3366816 RepID=UPI003BEF9545